MTNQKDNRHDIKLMNGADKLTEILDFNRDINWEKVDDKLVNYDDSEELYNIMRETRQIKRNSNDDYVFIYDEKKATLTYDTFNEGSLEMYDKYKAVFVTDNKDNVERVDIEKL